MNSKPLLPRPLLRLLLASFAISCLSHAQEISVEQPSGTPLVDGVSTLDFGSGAVGGMSPAKMVTIRNEGSVSLTGLAVTVTGTQANEFSVNTGGMATSLEAGGTTSFLVTAVPAASGVREASIQISSNDADESPFDVALSVTGVTALDVVQQAYLKASNPGVTDLFGFSVDLSGDTAVVGAYLEDSAATGVNGSQTDNSASSAGAAYVFVRSGTTWVQQAYLKASNTGTDDFFGRSVAIEGDTIAVGAVGEDSNATGVNGIQSNNSASSAGAVYVFARNGTTWSQQAYLKASNTAADASFGWKVALSGETLAVGVDWEDTGGVNSGAAYVFVRDGTAWSQQAFLKASNAQTNDEFGVSVAVSGDTLVVGATGEDSNAVGTGGNQADNSASNSGAAYVFVRSGTTWSQQAYLKASNTGASDGFGTSVAISGDRIVVGAPGEDSTGIGVNGDQTQTNSAYDSGAAYVFTRSGTAWSQQAYLKASNTGASDGFGGFVDLLGDHLLVGATGEDGSSGVNGDQSDNSMSSSGAAYLFSWSPAGWSQQAFLKASNRQAGDLFGETGVLSEDTVLIGAYSQNGGTTGVNGSQTTTGAANSGAVYAFRIPEPLPASPEIHVESAAGNVISDGGLLDLGDTSVDEPKLHSFTIRNTGSADLSDLSFTTHDSTDATSIGILGAPSEPIPPGGSATFTLSFTPAARLSQSAVLRIGSNDANENPFDIRLSWRGIIPEEIAVQQTLPVVADLTSGNAAPAFPVSATGIASEAKSFTITNAGDVALTGLALALSGPHAADFSASVIPTSLAPGFPLTFQVVFTPSADGLREAVLSISSSDPDENPFTIGLSGTGAHLPAEIGVSWIDPLTSGEGLLSFSRGDATKTLTIRNLGSEPLEGLGLSVTGPDAGKFSVGSPGATTLASGASTTVGVSFIADESRTYQATLSISSNDTDENPFVILLSGTRDRVYYWDHFAGSTAEPTLEGNTDGKGGDARFLRPWGVAVDGAGTVYLADTSNHLIKKISPNGVVTTFASGFNYPNRLAVDAAGFVYVADTFNNRIQKITPTGQQTTLAGGISMPRAVALDASENVYVAAAGDHTIRRVSPDGAVTLIAGSPGVPGNVTNAPGTSARFNAPAGIAVGADGTVYIADTGNNRICKYNGSLVTTFGPSFGSPQGIAVDASGLLIVPAAVENRIYAMHPSGTRWPIGGSGSQGNNAGFLAASRFYEPASVAVGPGGTLYVAGGQNHNVMVGRPQMMGLGNVALENRATRTAVIPGGWEDFHQVTTGVMVSRVFNFNNAGSFSIIGDHAADFSYTRTSTTLTVRFTPSALGVRNAQLMNGGYTMLNLTGTGVAPFVWSALAGSGTYPAVAGDQDGTGRAAGFRYPVGVVADVGENLFVADYSNLTIRKITPGGEVSTFAGLSGISGSADGVGGEARFSLPRGLAWGPDGVLYVSDSSWVRKVAADRTVTTLGSANFAWGIAVSAAGEVYGSNGNRILKMNAQGVTSVFAGTTALGVADGPALSASFFGPRGVAFDAAGNLFVADYGNRMIRKISPAGVVSTFAGSGVPGATDAQGSLATFDSPTDLGNDGAGGLLLTDGHRIRRISPSAQVTTVGGSSNSGNLEGIGTAAWFVSPRGISVTPDGRIHVAGGGNHNIMTGTPMIAGPDIAVVPVGDMSIPDGSAGANLGEIPGVPITRTFAIRNYGQAALENLSLALADGSSPDFSLTTTAGTGLASGGEASFSVTFTPSSTGPQAAAVEIASNDPDENPFVVHLAGTGLTVREKWRFDHFGAWENSGNGADDRDPDADGLENLLEFAFNLDPTTSGTPFLSDANGSSGLPLIRISGGRLLIEYLRRKTPSVGGIVYQPQFGSSLDTAPPDGWIDVSSPETVTDIDASWERVIVEDPAPGEPNRFGRVKVTAP